MYIDKKHITSTSNSMLCQLGHRKHKYNKIENIKCHFTSKKLPQTTKLKWVLITACQWVKTNFTLNTSSQLNSCCQLISGLRQHLPQSKYAFEADRFFEMSQQTSSSNPSGSDTSSTSSTPRSSSGSSPGSSPRPCITDGDNYRVIRGKKATSKIIVYEDKCYLIEKPGVEKISGEGLPQPVFYLKCKYSPSCQARAVIKKNKLEIRSTDKLHTCQENFGANLDKIAVQEALNKMKTRARVEGSTFYVSVEVVFVFVFVLLCACRVCLWKIEAIR